jgi:hypothetical protein
VIKVALNVTTLGPVFRASLEKHDAQKLVGLLRNVAQQTELDFAGIVTKEVKTLCHIGQQSIPKEPTLPNPIANLAIHQKTALAGTVIFDNAFLFAEDPELANRARIKFVPTKKATPRLETDELSGMTLAAAFNV